MYNDSFIHGLTGPYVYSIQNECPQAFDIIRLANTKVLRVCSFTDFHDFERAMSSGVQHFTVRPKWHHGRGLWRNHDHCGDGCNRENVLRMREWESEISVRDCIRQLIGMGASFTLEGPNEPDLECFPDIFNEETGLWMAEDPNIYTPTAEEFAYWWWEQVDIIRDSFPDIDIGSPMVAAGNLDRSNLWLDMLQGSYERANTLLSHDYAWNDGDGEGGLFNPAWGSMHVSLRDRYPGKPIRVTEANCDARLAREDWGWWYTALYEHFRATQDCASVTFFECQGTPGQEKHWIEHDVAQEIGWYTLIEDGTADPETIEQYRLQREQRRRELSGYYRESLLDDPIRDT